MTTRTLELNLRARADTKDLDKLVKDTGRLVEALRRTSTAFEDASGDAKKLAGVYSQLSAEEQKSVQAAARTATALDQAAAARERTARAAADALAAEQRIVVAQQAAEQATIKTATANERLAQSQANTSVSVARAAAAEEKLAQERQKTFQSTARSEKAELDVARAREQLRVATVRAEQAEKRIAETRKSTGLATDIVRKQLQALVAGGVAIQAGRQLIQFGRDSISAAADVEESSAKFQQVFKTLAEGVGADLEVMAEANRRSVYDLVDFASTLQDTFVPLGFARETAAEFSKTIVQLGIDIAAFSNKADAEVIDNLTSAIVGNHEAVRSYGIVLTETVLKQELARLGYSDLTGAALETAKAQARMNIIMRASADAQGAAVREAGSYTNTLKAWDAAVLDLKVSMGEGLLPVMTDLVEVAIQLTEAFKAGGEFGQPFDAALEQAKSLEDIVEIARRSKNELQELGFWEWFEVNLTSWKGLDLAEDQIIRIGQLAQSASEFQKVVGDEFSRLEISTAANNLGITEQDWNVDVVLADIYRVVQARQEQIRVTNELAEMEAAYERERAKIAAASASIQAEDILPAWIAEAEERGVMEAWSTWAAELGQYALASQRAAAARRELNIAFGESFQNAPVDALIEAQQSLNDATGEWRNVTVNRAGEIAAIQAQLAGDLTAEQKKQLQNQIKDLDEFSSEYMSIIGQLEADLSDSQRFDLMKQLTDLEGQHGSTARVYSGDIEAAEEAREAIIAANEAIAQSYYDRAYDSIAARLIETGEFEHLADLAVNLGIMTRAEADARTEYALTVAALDELTSSTEFYGLTAAQQAGAVKSLAAGIYETAAAALQAQENLKATQDFFAAGPDSYQIGQFYQQQADGIAADEGISTIVSLIIDPASEVEFATLRDNLEEFDDATYEAAIRSEYGTTIDDFDKMLIQLGELSDKPWIIKVKYETEGGAGGGGGGSTGSTGGTPPPAVPDNEYSPDSTRSSGAFVDLTVNNYGSGDVSGAVKTGVLAAFRSLG